MFYTGTLIFFNNDLYTLIKRKYTELIKERNDLDANHIFNINIERLCDYFIGQLIFEPPLFREIEISVAHHEINVEISQDPLRVIFEGDKPFFVKGTRFQFFVLYDGNQDLFYYRPSRYTLNPPRDIINPRELIVSFILIEYDSDKINLEFKNINSSIIECIDSIIPDVLPFNNSLKNKVRKQIEARAYKLLNDQSLILSLGFPIKRMEDAPQLYVVPSVHSKMSSTPTNQGVAPISLDQIPDMQLYEHIISVIGNMAMVIERTPKPIKTMQGEDLRQHFLIQINAHYKGQATGETFNFQGNTEILIRIADKNIFVVKCKFWRRQNKFKDAIDHFLNYSSWTDAKTALIIYNLAKQLSCILDQVLNIVMNYHNFIRKFDYTIETAFRFILHHRDNINREPILTVLVFEVPK